MKLLQINVTGNIGSTGRIAEAIGNIVQENGGESLIASGQIGQCGKSHYYQIGNKYDHISHAVQTRIFDRHGLYSILSTRRLINWIDKQTPDIIHLHNIHGYFLNYKILFRFLKQSEIPVVWTLHDCWAITGHCAYFDAANCFKWQTGCYSCSQKSSYPKSLLFDASAKNWDLKKKEFSTLPNMHLVTVSKWLELVVENSFLRKYPCRTIYNGVNTSRFFPAKTEETKMIKRKFGITEECKILLGVAYNWSERKGLSDYIQLSQILPANIRIVLVGIDAESKKRLPPNIIALKKSDSINDLVMLYSTADIVLNLSAEESFGLTTVEGFACGTPGIVYNKTASPELISEETGLIVSQGDLDGLYKAVLHILQKGKNHYSAYCRKAAIEKYDCNKNFNQYFELYQEILKHHF